MNKEQLKIYLYAGGIMALIAFTAFAFGTAYGMYKVGTNIEKALYDSFDHATADSMIFEVHGQLFNVTRINLTNMTITVNYSQIMKDSQK